MSLVTASAAVKCTAPGCTGYIEPTTNGAGVAIDRPCPECERRRSQLVRKRIELCPVDGCPGRVHVGFDTRGVRWVTVPCPYCERRATWEARALEHGVPDPACVICQAKIESGFYCDLCKVIVERARSRDYKRANGAEVVLPLFERRARARAIVKRYVAGENLADIAADVGLTSERCRQVLQAAGVPRRGGGADDDY